MLSARDLHEHHIKQTGGLSAITQTRSDFSRSLPGDYRAIWWWVDYAVIVLIIIIIRHHVLADIRAVVLLNSSVCIKVRFVDLDTWKNISVSLEWSFLRCCLPWKSIRIPYNNMAYIKAKFNAAVYPLWSLHYDEQEKNQQRDIFWKVLVSALCFSPSCQWELANCADTCWVYFICFSPSLRARCRFAWALSLSHVCGFMVPMPSDVNKLLQRC